MKHVLIAGSLLAALGAGATHGAGEDVRVSQVQNYKTWAQATKSAVKMSPRLWMLCRSPTPAEQKAVDDFNKSNPHSSGYLRVYMNNLAKAPLRNGTKFPPGSMLVKEKMVGPDTGLIARAVMVKHENGWNPKTGDWEFYTLSKDMKLEGTKPSTCISCHSGQAKSNWVFRTYLPLSVRR